MTIDDRAVRRLLTTEFPRETNQGMNRGYRTVASQFTRSFSAVALGRGGVFHAKRRVKLKYTKGEVRVAAAARKAGFVAALGGERSLEKKSLVVRTGNPLLVIRELGGTIRPKKGTRVRGKGSRAARKRIPYLAVRVKSGRGRGTRTEIRLVRSITYGAILGFRRHWGAFQPQTKAILDKAMADVVRRVNATSTKRLGRVA